MYESFLRKHWLVFVSSVAALSVLALQPLAGSIFDVQQVPESNMANAFSIRTLGLNPDRFQLTAFLATAGIHGARCWRAWRNTYDSCAYPSWISAPFSLSHHDRHYKYMAVDVYSGSGSGSGCPQQCQADREWAPGINQEHLIHPQVFRLLFKQNRIDHIRTFKEGRSRTRLVA